MPERKGALALEPKMLGILALPFLVITISFALMPIAGVPLNPLAKAVVANGHAEAAGRLKMLATWLLLLMIGGACIGYFLLNLRLFTSRTRIWLIGAFIALAGVGVGTVLTGAAEGPALIGERAIASAFAQGPHASIPDGIEADSPAGCPFVASYVLRCPADAAGWRMALMWWLNFLQRVLLALVSPALVLGTIACLAVPQRRPAPSSGRSPPGRLKTHLYLTAGLFVSGLLYLSALLRWPAFAFQGAGHEAYLAHVDAFVLYWGVTYTLYIASYYMPVALLLTAQGERDGIPEERLPAGQLLDWTKTLAALFAPAIVGLLGNVLHL